MVELVKLLRNNCRQSLSNFSKALGIDTVKIFGKLKKLEKYIIQRHTVLLNFKELGFPIQAIFFVKNTDNIELGCCVNQLTLLNDGNDVMIECVFRTMLEYCDFKQKLKNYHELHVIEHIARENFLSK